MNVKHYKVFFFSLYLKALLHMEDYHNLKVSFHIDKMNKKKFQKMILSLKFSIYYFPISYNCLL
jgi:hypothetical protein